ncbi:MAG: hypothetical protein AAF761_03420 [Pseudomonadota bacterium]
MFRLLRYLVVLAVLGASGLAIYGYFLPAPEPREVTVPVPLPEGLSGE